MIEKFRADVEFKAKNYTSTSQDRGNEASLSVDTSAPAQTRSYLPPTQRLSQVVLYPQYKNSMY